MTFTRKSELMRVRTNTDPKLNIERNLWFEYDLHPIAVINRKRLVSFFVETEDGLIDNCQVIYLH